MIRLQLFTILTCVCFFGSVGWSQVPPINQQGTTNAGPNEAVQDKIGKQNAEARAEATCKADMDKVTDAMKDLNKACSEAKLGSKSECLTRANECEEITADKEYKNTDVSLSDSDKTLCPMSTDQAKDLETQIEKLEKKTEDLQSQAVKDKKEAAKDLSTVQKEIADMDKTYSDDKASSSQEDAKRRSDESKTLMQLAEETESAHATILEAQAKKADMLSKKAESLAQLTAAIVQQDCEANVMEVAKKLGYGSSSKGTITSGIKMKNNITVRYQACIKAKNQLRASIITSYENQLAQIDNTIDRVNATITRKNQQIAEAKASAVTAAAAATTKGQAIEAKYQADKGRIANDLQNMSTNTTEKETNIRTNTASAQAKLTKASNDLARIGGSEAKGVKSTFNDVLDKRINFSSAFNNYNPACCPKDSTASICTAKTASDSKNLDAAKLLDQMSGNSGGAK